jgi:tRNA 2-thiouridine synthesizing protein A
MSETIMNLRGLKCPQPALRVRKMLSALKSGDVIVVECTDPLTTIDIPNLLRQTGDTLEGRPRLTEYSPSASARNDYCGRTSSGRFQTTVFLPFLNTATGWAISATACSGVRALMTTTSAGLPTLNP